MDTALPYLLLFDPEENARAGKPGTKPADIDTLQEQRLVCARCRHAITREDERIAVHGGHEHTRTNPHNLTFHIGCFRRADGCKTFGPASLEYTWFAGYAWSIALCGNCQTHLGWRFTSTLDSFYGLVLRELISAGV